MLIVSAKRLPNISAAMDDKKITGAYLAAWNELSKPSISVFDGTKGTVLLALNNLVIIEVYEGDASRKIEFTSDIFYKDNERVSGDLRDVLGQGDEVTLDYMVGWTGRDEVVHCSAVWQGEKPQSALCLDPDEFSRKLHVEEPASFDGTSFDGTSFEGTSFDGTSFDEPGYGRDGNGDFVPYAHERPEVLGGTEPPMRHYSQADTGVLLYNQCSTPSSEVPANASGGAHGGAHPTAEKTFEWLTSRISQEVRRVLREEMDEAVQRFRRGDYRIERRDAGTQTDDDSSPTDHH